MDSIPYVASNYLAHKLFLAHKLRRKQFKNCLQHCASTPYVASNVLRQSSDSDVSVRRSLHYLFSVSNTYMTWWLLLFINKQVKQKYERFCLDSNNNNVKPYWQLYVAAILRKVDISVWLVFWSVVSVCNRYLLVEFIFCYHLSRTTLTVDHGGELAIQQLLMSHPLTNSILFPSSLGR